MYPVQIQSSQPATVANSKQDKQLQKMLSRDQSDAKPHALSAGFSVGRTPLIKLSPKKTWEGFIGGALVTLVASWYLASLMSRYKWMTCERNVRTPGQGLQLGFMQLASLSLISAGVPQKHVP